MEAKKLPLDISSEYLNYLENVPLLVDLKSEPETLKDLLLYMTQKSYSAGETIIQESKSGSEMFFLVQGKVGVFKSTPSGDEYKVTEVTMHEMSFFGEGSLIDSEVRSASIRALDNCQCLILDSKDFLTFSKNHPLAALSIFRKISQTVLFRLRKTNNDFMMLYNALVSEIRGHTA